MQNHRYVSKVQATTFNETGSPYGSLPSATVSLNVPASAHGRVFVVTFTAKVVDMNGASYASFGAYAGPGINALDFAEHFDLDADGQTRSVTAAVIADPGAPAQFNASLQLTSDAVGTVADLQVVAVEV